jgi:hypothetical protein
VLNKIEATVAAGAVAAPGGDELGIFRGSAVFGSEDNNGSGITEIAASNGSCVFIWLCSKLLEATLHGACQVKPMASPIF